MSTVPQAPQPTPPAPIPDAFDKALALSREFTAQELTILRESNRQVVDLLQLAGRVAAGIAVVFGGILVFLGFRTMSEVRETAKSEIAKQLPSYVHDETEKQFKQANVGQVVQSLVEKTANAKIDALIAERVGPIISEQVRLQRAQLEVEIRREIANQSRQTRAGNVPQVPPGRSITDAQRSAFHDAVHRSEILNAKDQHQELYPRFITIFIDPSDREANAYATQLKVLLVGEGWTADVIGDHIDNVSGPGLHFVQKGNISSGSRWLGMRANVDLFRCLRLGGFEGDGPMIPAKPTQETTFIVVGPNPLAK